MTDPDDLARPVSLLGRDADALAALYAEDPVAVVREVQRALDTGRLGGAAAEAARRLVEVPLAAGGLPGAITVEVGEGWTSPQVLPSGPGGAVPPPDDPTAGLFRPRTWPEVAVDRSVFTALSSDWSLFWRRTGRRWEVLDYAPLLDIGVADALDGALTAAVTFASTEERAAGVDVTIPGLMASADFSRSVTWTSAFPATRGSFQLSLPILVEIVEYRHNYTDALDYEGFCLATGPAPVQVRRGAPEYRAVTPGGWMSWPLGSGVHPLDETVAIARGTSAGMTLTVTPEEGVSVDFGCTVALKRDLTLALACKHPGLYWLSVAEAGGLAYRVSPIPPPERRKVR